MSHLIERFIEARPAYRRGVGVCSDGCQFLDGDICTFTDPPWTILDGSICYGWVRAICAFYKETATELSVTTMALARHSHGDFSDNLLDAETIKA